MKYKQKSKNFILINKSVFFPKQKILAIADPHLGYEQMLNQQGIQIPFNQLEETKKQLEKILDNLKKQNKKIKKIIILGDLKHNFPFDKSESYEIFDFIRFLEKFFKKEDIILIKGNHEKIVLDKSKYRDYYVTKDTAFIHGDKLHKKILKKEIKTIVLGHLHPAITLKEKTGIKKEKYKCFLIGKYKNKEFIILSSFFPFKEGSDISEYDEYNKDKFIIPKSKLKDFNVHVIGKNKIYDFGELKDLD